MVSLVFRSRQDDKVKARIKLYVASVSSFAYALTYSHHKGIYRRLLLDGKLIAREARYQGL